MRKPGLLPCASVDLHLISRRLNEGRVQHHSQFVQGMPSRSLPTTTTTLERYLPSKLEDVLYCSRPETDFSILNHKSDFSVVTAVTLWLPGISSCCPGAARRELELFCVVRDNLLFSLLLAFPTIKTVWF